MPSAFIRAVRQVPPLQMEGRPVTPESRVAAALARIPNSKLRGEIADAVEALADAIQFQPSGFGASELSGVQAGGFESSVPDGLRLLAAQVERKGRAVLQEAVQRFRGELRRIHSEAGAFRGVAHVYERQGPGRPTVVTPEMLTEAHRCRSAGLTPDATVRALCEKFTASESALRSNLKRGAVPSTGGPTAARLLHLAVYGGGMAPQPIRGPQTPANVF